MNSWDIESPGKAPWKVLLPIDQAHPILRFNPYILHGYRCNLRLWHCVRSMAFLHNESCNSMSHFFAFIYFSSIALRFYKEGAYPNLLQVSSRARIRPFVPPFLRIACAAVCQPHSRHLSAGDPCVHLHGSKRHVPHVHELRLLLPTPAHC